MNDQSEHWEDGRLDVQPSVWMRIADGQPLAGTLIQLNSNGARVQLQQSCGVTVGDAVELSIAWSLPASTWSRDEVCHGRISTSDVGGLIGIEFLELRAPQTMGEPAFSRAA